MVETLGQRIRKKRSEQNLGLREMARMLGISATYLSLIEVGDRTPPSEYTIKKIAQVLDDDFDVLMHIAGRVPSDVEEMLTRDPNLLLFLRLAKAKGLTGKKLLGDLKCKCR